MSKKTCREEALKKEKQKKQKKIVILLVCVLIAALVISLLVFNVSQKKGDRLFTDGHQTVTLRTNGTFTARLAHDSRTGTYTEKKDGEVITISFTTEGTTVTGEITNDELTIPDEWDDDHGHGSKLRLKR